MAHSFFSYRVLPPNERSALHEVAALPKLLALFVLCFVNNLHALFFCSTLIFLLSGFHLSTILNITSVIAIGVFVTAVKVLSTILTFGVDWGLLAEAAKSGALYCAVFFLVTLAAQSVFETTSFLELYEAVDDLPFIGGSTFSLMIILSVSFICDVFEVFSKVKVAAAARGGKGLFCEVQKLSSALTTLFFHALKKRQALLMRLNAAAG